MPENQDGECQMVEDKAEETVLRVSMHCEGCATKVSSCFRGFEGVEEVRIDRANNKVFVRGEEADPVKVFERIQKKYSTRNVELISPKPKPKPKPKPDEEGDKKQPENKQAEAKLVMMLKMYMHCGGCARDIQKTIARMKGVSRVEADMSKSQVMVKGAFDSQKLAETIRRKLGKHVEIVKQEPASAPAPAPAPKPAPKNAMNIEKDEQKNAMIHYPPQYPYPSSCQIFSDENVYSCFIM